MQMATNLEVSTMFILTKIIDHNILNSIKIYLLDLFTIYQMSDVKCDVDEEKKDVRLKIYQCIIVTATLFRLTNYVLY